MRHLMLAALILLTACASEADLFDRAPPGRPVKVIVLEVEGSRATLVASEVVLFDVERLPGVLAVSRGSGRNEVQCLVDMKVEGQDLMSALTPRYRVKVLRTVLRKDLPPEEE